MDVNHASHGGFSEARRAPLKVVMFFGNSEPTDYDLRFELFRIPVRVHPSFWLLAAMLGWRNLQLPNGPILLFIWVLAVFVHILVHEFGHALTARHYGWPPQVVLYGMGGFAAFHPGRGYTTGKHVLTLFAGPGAGFLLFLAIQLAWPYVARLRPNDFVVEFVSNLQTLNIVWGIFNLLPIFPLDGGQISRLLLTHWFPRAGFVWSLRISFGFAAVLCLIGILSNSMLLAIMMGMFAAESYMALQQSRY